MLAINLHIVRDQSYNMTRLKAREINCKYEKPGKYLVHCTWLSAINDMYYLTFTVITNSRSFII